MFSIILFSLTLLDLDDQKGYLLLTFTALNLFQSQLFRLVRIHQVLDILLC